MGEAGGGNEALEGGVHEAGVAEIFQADWGWGVGILGC